MTKMIHLYITHIVVHTMTRMIALYISLAVAYIMATMICLYMACIVAYIMIRMLAHLYGSHSRQSLYFSYIPAHYNRKKLVLIPTKYNGCI